MKTTFYIKKSGNRKISYDGKHNRMNLHDLHLDGLQEVKFDIDFIGSHHPRSKFPNRQWINITKFMLLYFIVYTYNTLTQTNRNHCLIPSRIIFLYHRLYSLGSNKDNIK